MESPSPLLSVRHAAGSYPVFVGRGLADRVGAVLAPRGDVFILTSPGLRPLWGERVAASFSPGAQLVIVEEGEARKDLATADRIVTQLLERGARRDSLLVVVGGGMLGDTGGFAASIFLRGIDLVQVPTTLLAMVDSSIGGKVGVNHSLGKNLLGAFHPPRAVVTDPGCLDTLPDRELTGGLFEALKAGVIGDASLFELFASHADALLRRDPAVLDDAIARAIRVKAGIVSADEREGGIRRLLNYGHTIGHAVEAVLRYERVSHGEAVAWGMVAANAIAVGRGLLSQSNAAEIDRAIETLAPHPLPTIDRSHVVAATAFDKKNLSRRRVMVLMRAVGDPVIVDDVGDDEVAFGVDAMLARSSMRAPQRGV